MVESSKVISSDQFFTRHAPSLHSGVAAGQSLLSMHCWQRSASLQKGVAAGQSVLVAQTLHSLLRLQIGVAVPWQLALVTH
jgi:hypothetical protein